MDDYLQRSKYHVPGVAPECSTSRSRERAWERREVCNFKVKAIGGWTNANDGCNQWEPSLDVTNDNAYNMYVVVITQHEAAVIQLWVVRVQFYPDYKLSHQLP